MGTDCPGGGGSGRGATGLTAIKSDCGGLPESAAMAVVDVGAGGDAQPSPAGPTPDTMPSRTTGDMDLAAAPRRALACSGAVAGTAAILLGVVVATGARFLGVNGVAASQGEPR